MDYHKEFISPSSRATESVCAKHGRSKRPRERLPCCLCYDCQWTAQSVGKDPSSFAQSGCLMQEYFMQSNDQRKQEIVDYGEEMNIVLRAEVARLKAKLALFG